MVTNFDAMSHEGIYEVVKAGTPTTVSGAASQLAALNTTISGHLDTLDKLSTSMADAWPDENGQNFRATLSDTIRYLRELQATHVVAASSSITQVMSASHEKLSHTQATIPAPPAVPVATQEQALNKSLAANHDAMNAGLAAASHRIAAGKADDAKAVQLAKSLANTYLAEKAKLTAPPAAPRGPGSNGGGTAPTAGGSSGTSSNHAMSDFRPTDSGGTSAANLVSGGTSDSGGDGNGDGSSTTFTPVHGGGGTGGVHYGSDGGSSGGGTGAETGQNSSNHGTLLDPNGPGPFYDAHGNLIGGSGSDPSSPGATGPVSGVLGGPGPDGGGGGLGAGGLGAVGGGLVAGGVIAARKEAARRAALLQQELLDEELAANGAGGAGGLSAGQLAAINAQRTGVLAAGQQAGLMSGERTMLSAQQRGLVGANVAMTAEEEAQLAANQRLVPGQLGATPATAAAAGARTAVPFAGGGVVGAAERVTWLIEDRDLFSADPGVRAIVED